MSVKVLISLEDDNTTVGEQVGDLESDMIIDTSEDRDPEEKPAPTVLVMKGPLSEIYTKALNLVYAKQDDQKGLSLVATESMANDVIMQAAIKEATNIKKPKLMTLEVSDDFKQSTDIAFVTTAVDFNTNKAMGTLGSLSELSNTYPNANVSLVLDGGATGRFAASIGTSDELGLGNNESNITLKNSVESICNKLNIKTYYSLNDYVTALGKKK